MKILIIAGHGQGDPGACSRSFKEAELVREIVPTLASSLRRYADVTVFDTTKNMYKHLKAGKSFDFKPYDYVFELHFNAVKEEQVEDDRTKGVEILVHTSEKATSVEQLIVDNISAIGFTNRGVKTRSNLLNMNICKGQQGVSYALLETCFIDDIDDMQLYIANKDRVVSAITNGIVHGFGLSEEDEKVDMFTDISEHYARDAINDLAKMEIVHGKGYGIFDPQAPITRGDVAIIARNVIRYITGK